MVKEAYVSFEVAKLLKEKGFRERIYSYYKKGHKNPMYTTQFPSNWNEEMLHQDCISAPTLQFTLSWLREKGIIVDVLAQSNKTKNPKYMYNIWDYTYPQWNRHIEQYQPDFVGSKLDFPTYEQAVEEALKYVLENLS